jgi:acyl-coenzyme A synthetase/AMP-(fatty) acid ligase
MPQDASKATPELAEAIKAWLAERVSRHKRLEGGVHFIDAVPKNPVSAKTYSLRILLTLS